MPAKAIRRKVVREHKLRVAEQDDRIDVWIDTWHCYATIAHPGDRQYHEAAWVRINDYVRTHIREIAALERNTSDGLH